MLPMYNLHLSSGSPQISSLGPPDPGYQRGVKAKAMCIYFGTIGDIVSLPFYRSLLLLNFARMLFKNVIGQADVKTHLVNMVQQDRISHALLFLGKEGCGALPLAIAFAQYIVCEKVNRKGAAAPTGPSLFGEEMPAPTQNEAMPDACGECPSCQKMLTLMHPDIHFSDRKSTRL